MSRVVDALENLREIWEEDEEVNLDALEQGINEALIAAGQDPLLHNPPSGIKITGNLTHNPSLDGFLDDIRPHVESANWDRLYTLVNNRLVELGHAPLRPIKFTGFGSGEEATFNFVRDQALDEEVLHLLSTWGERFSFDNDRQWLDEIDGTIKDIAKLFGHAFASPIFGMRVVNGDKGGQS